MEFLAQMVLLLVIFFNVLFVFLNSDHKLLIVTFRIGRHPCLWCEIKQEEMKIPKDKRDSTKRTLYSLETDLAAFREAGGNLKHAKQYNNVIDDVYFNISIDHVINYYIKMKL